MFNLECDGCYHVACVNLDSAPCGPTVWRFDTRERPPFDDHSADVVYYSHLLEHLAVGEGIALLRECRRVLRAGGIIRVVVPNLEGIARAYLSALDDAAKGGDGTLHRWTRMELLDQAARAVSGGDMVPFIRCLSDEQRTLVRTRAGRALDPILHVAIRWAWWKRVAVARALDKLRRDSLRGWVWFLGGRRAVAALDEGRFRQSGEIHRLMHDRVALACLLEDCGFTHAMVMSAAQSRMPRFTSFELDTVGGEVRKPDSLFMEALKP